MKKFDKKIGNRTKKMSEEKVAQKSVQAVIAVLLILSLSACEKAWHGSDGRPGDAFLSLMWNVEEPLYIDAGTGAIPPIFYWGEYYEIQPGQYDLYYEGEVWTGMSWATYAWEVEYMIWELPGERGDWYSHGENGPDNFFIIECNPYGPYIESRYKSSEVLSDYELVEEKEDEVTVSQKLDGFELIITYKKTEPRLNETR